MSVRLTPDEAWGVLERAHTGILTTLRRDGYPIALPMWFACVDHDDAQRPGASASASATIPGPPSWSKEVSSGLSSKRCTSPVPARSSISTPASGARFQAEIDRKYAAFRTASTEMPQATRNHYAGRTYLRLVPDDRILSWDNRKLGLT